ncbi:type II secretion system F family protein [Patescibacteria group bacterium]|nr:type II secretion system F family protein [Patescibacteria group bacterium]
MSTFIYKAKKISGEEVESRREAVDRFDLARQLRKEGYFLVSYKKERVKGAGLRLLSLFERVPLQEKMVFARNLAVMAGAGVSLIRALDILSRQTENKKFSSVLVFLGAEIRKGRTLTQAMESHPKVFSPLFRSMVKSGEASGKLEEALTLVGQQLERDYDLRRKVRGAFIYPAVILVAMVMIGIIMLIYVVPTLLVTFEELEVDLPPTTAFIVFVSSFFLNHGILAFFLAIFFIGALWYLGSRESGKKMIGNLFLRFPVISGIIKKMNSARTSRTLSSLISSGVDIIEALDVTRDVIQNYRFKKVLEEAKKEIQKGNPISAVFIRHSNLYPLLVGEMIAVGEETGKLSEMLLRLATFYESEVADETKALSTIIEPVLMIVIGIAVGFFAISMIQPLYSVVGGL